MGGNSCDSDGNAGEEGSSVGIVRDIPIPSTCKCSLAPTGLDGGGGMADCIVGSVADALNFAVFHTRLARGMVSESFSVSDDS